MIFCAEHLSDTELHLRVFMHVHMKKNKKGKYIFPML